MSSILVNRFQQQRLGCWTRRERGLRGGGMQPTAAKLYGPAAATMAWRHCSSSDLNRTPKAKDWRNAGRSSAPGVVAVFDLEAAETAATALAEAASAATSAVVSEPLVTATGVPILTTLTQCSLEEAVVRGAKVLLLTAAGAAVGRVMLAAVAKQRKKRGRALSEVDALGRLRPFPILLTSLAWEAYRLLPFATLAFSATVLCALGQVAAESRQQQLAAWIGSGTTSLVQAVLRWATQFLQDAAEEVLILLCSFTLLDVKERVVQHFRQRMLEDQDVTNDAAVWLVEAGGKLVSVVVWALFVLVTLANYGINLRPILASLGASSLLVGIAAQTLLRNLAAGITLYTSRPFSVGDDIQLITVEGDPVVEGRVLALQPTRTVIQSSEGGSTIFVNNGDLEGMIVENKRRAPLGRGAAVAADAHPTA